VAGRLKFIGAANTFGTAYARFTFQVQDDGGTANGGFDTDPTPRQITVNLASVNDAPVGTPKTVTTLEDKSYKFALADFGLTDPNDSPANALLSVKMTTIPTPSAGILTNNGTAVTAGSLMSVADINAGNLLFVPKANRFGSSLASFKFQVRDNGGTAN